ncbi:MAG: Rrf2 family transcriptional regulator, partial [Gemmataceae bacterium]|nr:Rrf2 family transcriptional regulator [Gemmataceae bacterium]
MTLLSRKADYALLVLSYLYQHKAGGTAKAAADQFGLSRPFVANILKELCGKGFVTSHRGVKGGYTLARDAAAVTLAELLESMEDGFR